MQTCSPAANGNRTHFRYDRVVAHDVRLRVSGLRVQHGSRTAVSDVDLDIAAGTSVAVIGANGSGKSPLLRAIAGLQTPVTGTGDRSDEHTSELQSLMRLSYSVFCL